MLKIEKFANFIKEIIYFNDNNNKLNTLKSSQYEETKWTIILKLDLFVNNV